MDSSNGEGVGAVTEAEKPNIRKGEEDTTLKESNCREKALGLKGKNGVGSISSKDMFFRADKIDFNSWDIQLERHLSRAWEREVQTRKEAWEIDLSKLDLRYDIAHGTYGIVYRGVYDGQDVAGNLRFLSGLVLLEIPRLFGLMM